jgi:hypothetical protein
MRSKLAAALLSGLVFPGSGQWYLGRHKRALLFLGPAAAGGIAYGSHALDAANTIADRVLGGGIPLDPIAIAAQIDALPSPAWVTVAGAVFVACWVGSIVEALAVRTP